MCGILRVLLSAKLVSFSIQISETEKRITIKQFTNTICVKDNRKDLKKINQCSREKNRDEAKLLIFFVQKRNVSPKNRRMKQNRTREREMDQPAKSSQKTKQEEKENTEEAHRIVRGQDQ